MKLSLYQINAFTDYIFGGNPAGVMPLDAWLPNDLLLKIARENAIAETAYFIDNGHDTIALRWFTPDIEMDLCGHATLATAHCLWALHHYPKNEIRFDTLSGVLVVSRKNDLYCLDLPSRMPQPALLPDTIAQALNILPREVYKARDYVLVYDSEEDIRQISIDRPIFDRINLNPGGVIVTATGKNCDFVSRFFTPQATILEDPVTGSAHCSLVPFWASRLGKKNLTAMQLSDRIGQLYCEDHNERIMLAGQAKTYSVGHCWTA